MCIDYRTKRHQGKYVVFLEAADGTIDAAIFSSFGATLKFLKLMCNYKATVHDRAGDVVAFMHHGGITIKI